MHNDEPICVTRDLNTGLLNRRLTIVVIYNPRAMGERCKLKQDVHNDCVRVLYYAVSTVFSFLDLNHLCQRIPRGVLEEVYGINITHPRRGKIPTELHMLMSCCLLMAVSCSFLSHGIHNLVVVFLSSTELCLVHKMCPMS